MINQDESFLRCRLQCTLVSPQPLVCRSGTAKFGTSLWTLADKQQEAGVECRYASRVIQSVQNGADDPLLIQRPQSKVLEV